MMTDNAQVVCLVEDDAIMGQSLKDRLELEGIDCDWCQTLAEARSRITAHRYAAVVSDIRLPDGNGESLLDELLVSSGQIPPLIYITAYGDLQQAVGLLRRGAADYITKPFDMDAFLEKLRSLCPDCAAQPERLGPSVPVLGCSAAMKRMQELLTRIAGHDVPVLITGESGVGKEHAALFLHQAAYGNGESPFVAVNCAAIPEGLMETELFGHESGAFTGARNLHKGLFEQAQGGTLFLDEIGEMPASMQSKLLRAIQEKAIRRVGGTSAIPTSVRLVCATNRDLCQAVENGSFREDLFFRINIIPVHIPPLRERPEDIAWFAESFIDDHNRRSGRPPKQLSAAARTFLQQQEWPGNVRELYNRIERICILSDKTTIGIMELSGNPALSAPATPLRDDHSSLKDYLESCERDYIVRMLEQESGRIAATAAQLGISRKNLWERMRKLGIQSSNTQDTDV